MDVIALAGASELLPTTILSCRGAVDSAGLWFLGRRYALPQATIPAPFQGARADLRFVVSPWPFANETLIPVFTARNVEYSRVIVSLKQPSVRIPESFSFFVNL